MPILRGGGTRGRVARPLKNLWYAERHRHREAKRARGARGMAGYIEARRPVYRVYIGTTDMVDVFTASSSHTNRVTSFL